MNRDVEGERGEPVTLGTLMRAFEEWHNDAAAYRKRVRKVTYLQGLYLFDGQGQGEQGLCGTCKKRPVDCDC
jgi:hypothetical protein